MGDRKDLPQHGGYARMTRLYEFTDKTVALPNKLAGIVSLWNKHGSRQCDDNYHDIDRCSYGWTVVCAHFASYTAFPFHSLCCRCPAT